MNNLLRLFASTICLLTFAAPASSSSVLVLEDTGSHNSIIRLGKPLNCKVEKCPEAVAVGEAPKSGALVDAFGMPTNMPTLIRGGDSSDIPVVVAPKAIAAVPQPATTAPAAAQPAAPVAEAAPPAAEPAPAGAPGVIR